MAEISHRNKTIIDFCFRSICLFAYLNIHNIDLGYREVNIGFVGLQTNILTENKSQ